MLCEEKFFSLQGKWALERSTNGFGKMQGIASFFPLSPPFPPSLLYREDGTFFTVSAGHFYFFREYIFLLNNKKIEIYFSSNKKKGDLFLSLSFSSSDECVAKGIHSCKKDTYSAAYRFLDEDTFTLHYDIKGPQKNILIETLFKRQAFIHD